MPIFEVFLFLIGNKKFTFGNYMVLYIMQKLSLVKEKQYQYNKNNQMNFFKSAA